MDKKIQYQILQNQGAIMLALSTLLGTRGDLFAKMSVGDLEGCVKKTGVLMKGLKSKSKKKDGEG